MWRQRLLKATHSVTDSPPHDTVDMGEYGSDMDLPVDGRVTRFVPDFLSTQTSGMFDSSPPTDHPELDENAIEDWPSLATAPEGITVAGDIENTRSLNDAEQNMNPDVRRAIPDIINTIRRLRGMEPLSHEAQEDMATLDVGADTIAASGGAASAGDLPIHTSNHASDAVSIGSRPTDALDSGVELEEDNVYPSMQVSRSCNVSQSHSFLARDVDMNNHTSVNPPAPFTILLRAPAPEALYFVGIDLSSYNGRQNTQLMERGRLLSRTLSAVRQDMNVYGQLLLGSADIPTDVVDNYMHYSCNFHEIGLWSSQEARADSHHLEASPPSPQRTRLITQRHLPATTNVFILYCYLQDTIPLRITTHPPPSTSPRERAASLNELCVMPPPTHESWSSTTAEEWASLHQALSDDFMLETAQFRDWRSRGYGTGYMNCLIERHLMRVCTAVGIQFGSGIIQRGQLRGLRVEPTHVAAWAGIPLSTFAGLRTQWTRARDALMRLHSAVEADITLSTEQMLTLRILEAMLSDTILPPARPNYPGTAAEMEAVRIRTGRVDDLVAAIRQDIVLHVQ
ncbi:hypothetical protein EW146_g9692 [Bondarzewia mesenterica]|uniref:Uncharacterized protein n=1 Tax=Bondarzewia mesenterica TaxID=1095465 RepID=A0A4S4L5L3_9AGAM|nr:hypothetical protein EW146_g9692 [Bondarzewia mesenterica]